jgi:hypothetical protein
VKAAIIAALNRSPWALLGVAVVLLLALWLVLSRSYSLRFQGGDMRLELAPAQSSPLPSAVAVTPR